MKKNKISPPQYIAISVFLICMAALWPGVNQENDWSAMYVIAGLYTVICLGFLLFQLYAFAHSHLVYDDEVEEIKMQVFTAEESEHGKKITASEEELFDSFYHR